MYIQSKLLEASKTVCDLKLNDEYHEDLPIQQENRIDKRGNHLDVDSKLLYTSGFCLIETHFSIRKKVTDRFRIDGEHVQLTFFLNGKSRVCELSQDLSFDLDIGWMRRNYFNNCIREFEMRAKNEVNYVAIFMSKDFFLKLIQKEGWVKHDAFIQYIIAKPAKDLVDETSTVTLPILKLLQELTGNTYKDLYKRYYMELKLRELLFLLHKQYTILPAALGLESATYSTIEKVKAYLVAHYDCPPTIKQLSRMFSLNELKLKQSFKAVYGTTIYAYVIQLRMEQAKKMLLENYSVNEMSSLLGYRSVSHFIGTYKKYFGHTPKQDLKKVSQILPLTFFHCLFKSVVQFILIR